MIRCPRCSTPTLSAERGTEQFCPACREIVSRMTTANMPRKRAEAAVRGTSDACGASTVQAITFDLPLPMAGCSSNARNAGHWSVAAKARREYRAECLACLPRIDYMFSRMFVAATISTEWFLGSAPGRYHPRDAGNAISAFKSGCDAIVEAGYIADDNATVLHWGETVLRTARESGALACVRVVLTRRA